MFLSVFLGLAVEEIEQAKGLDLELSDQDVSAASDRPRQSLKDLNCTVETRSDTIRGRLPLRTAFPPS